MALISCPECGKEVSTEASSCPHCGYPLSKTTNIKRTSMYAPAPKSREWMKEWKMKIVVNRLVWFFLTIFFCIPLVVGFLMQNHVLILVGFIIPISPFIILIAALTDCHIRTRTVNGYTILVYRGLVRNALVIEGESVECGATRYLKGSLPNGESVRVGIAWYGAVKIDVGAEKTF